MDLKEKEKKFDNFLNKTIILSSKKFYKEESQLREVECNIIDDESFDTYISKYIGVNQSTNCKDIIDLINEINNVRLVKAIESLSNIEKTVIFLLFEKELTSNEASKILKICSDSVTRIRKRAIKKLENYLKEEQ